MGKLCGGAHEISGIPASICLCGWVVEEFMGWVGGWCVEGWDGWWLGGWVSWCMVGYFVSYSSDGRSSHLPKLGHPCHGGCHGGIRSHEISGIKAPLSLWVGGLRVLGVGGWWWGSSGGVGGEVVGWVGGTVGGGGEGGVLVRVGWVDLGRVGGGLFCKL